MWIFVLAGINLVLLLISLLFFMPKEFFKKTKFGILGIYDAFRRQANPILIIVVVVAFHLLEVKFIDPRITELVNHDYASAIRGFEGDTVYWFSQHWITVLVYFFVIMYIAVYPFTLWFSPLYFIINNEKKSNEIIGLWFTANICSCPPILPVFTDNKCLHLL